MRRISTFVQIPALLSLEAGIALLAEGELFSTYSLKLDSELFPLLLEAKPCVLVLSLSDPASSAEIAKFLTDFKAYRLLNGGLARDPACRIVLVSDAKVPRVSWAHYGVYEVMVAPVTAYVFDFKMSRHYHKALTAEEATLEQPTLLNSVTEMKEPSSKNQWKILLKKEKPKLSGLETPETEGSQKHERPKIDVYRAIVCTALDELKPDEGIWARLEPIEEESEAQWEWKPNHESIPKKPTWIYTGEIPSYDPKSRSWIFAGDAPKLMRGYREDPKHYQTEFECTFGPAEELTLNVAGGISVKSFKSETYSFVPSNAKPTPRFTSIGLDSENPVRHHPSQSEKLGRTQLSPLKNSDPERQSKTWRSKIDLPIASAPEQSTGANPELALDLQTQPRMEAHALLQGLKQQLLDKKMESIRGASPPIAKMSPYLSGPLSGNLPGPMTGSLRSPLSRSSSGGELQSGRNPHPSLASDEPQVNGSSESALKVKSVIDLAPHATLNSSLKSALNSSGGDPPHVNRNHEMKGEGMRGKEKTAPHPPLADGLKRADDLVGLNKNSLISEAPLASAELNASMFPSLEKEGIHSKLTSDQKSEIPIHNRIGKSEENTISLSLLFDANENASIRAKAKPSAELKPSEETPVTEKPPEMWKFKFIRKLAKYRKKLDGPKRLAPVKVLTELEIQGFLDKVLQFFTKLFS